MGLFDDLRDVGRDLLGVAADAMGRLAKADEDPDLSRPEVSPPAPHQPGQSDMPPDEKAIMDPHSLFYDPFAIIEQLGYKEKPSQINYGTLRNMVWKVPIIQAVIQTRIQQVAAFAKPQTNRYQMGFRIRLRDHDSKLTPVDRKWARKCEDLLLTTGVTDHPRGRDNFEAFIRKLAFDSLTYDQACYEIVPNHLGQPAEWYAVDASSIRIADTATTYMNEDLDQAIRYVQIYDGMIVAEYRQDELMFGVRNPRTDIRLHGYGTSELEMLVPAVTSLLWAWQYNSKFFSQGSAAKGILNFKGAIPEKQLRAFRRHWYQMLSSVENAWRTPITNSDDLQWINMQNNNRDMEFSAWMDFLIKVVCSLYSMDPVEVNFQYGNIGQTASLQEKSNREKITESKERGLRPLLNFLSTWINRGLIWPMNENFEFEFVGLDARTRDEVMTYVSQAVRNVRTIDELRAEDDLPPLPDGTGKIILDPNWLQVHQQAQQTQQQQMQSMAAANGPPPAPPGMPGMGGMPPEGGQPPTPGADGMPGEMGGQPEHSPPTEVPFQKLVAQGEGENKGEEDEQQKSMTAKRSKSIIVDVVL